MVRGRSLPFALAFVVAAGLLGPAGASPRPVSAAQAEAKIDDDLRRRFRARPMQQFVVEFAERANLRPARAIRSFERRGAFVRRSLVSTARRSQAAARRLVASRPGAAGRSFWLTNVLVVRGRLSLARSLARLPEVTRVRPVKRYRLVEPVSTKEAVAAAAGDPEWGVERIGADGAWEEGITGQGIVVANLDTGVDFLHPALVSQYRGNNGDGTFTHDYNWWDPSGICGDTPCDNAGHGTHVMGTMVGGDGPGPFSPDIGVAPGARWIAAKGCEDFFCTETSLLSGGQFLLAPTDSDGRNPDPSRRPDVVNNSWGSDDPSDTFFLGIVEAWRAAGIVPVFANGNAGPECASAGTPGNFEQVLGIGATDDDDEIAFFSSRGPSPAGIVKPDVSAPGVDVLSSVPSEGYEEFSGTSMAAPHVAGAVALMLSARQELLGRFDPMVAALRSTAVDRIDTECGGDEDGDPNNVYGDGRIDALAAVRLVKTGGTLAGTVTDEETGDPIPGARVVADNGEREFVALTDDSGAYQLFLAAGTYTVRAEAFGYAGRIAAGVEVVQDETTTRSFALPPLPRFTVSGTVRGAEDGEPLEGVKVQAIGVPVAPVFTGPGGGYRLTLPVGSYGLRAAGGGCTESGFAEVTLVDADVERDFSLFRKLDGFGHGCRPVPFDWVDARFQSALFGDEVAGRLRLPFEFPFYGETYGQVFISDNGYLNFLAPDQFNSFPVEIPSRDAPNAAIYPLWQDLSLDEGSGIDYDTVGEAPQRAFVIEFSQVRAAGARERLDFEVKLWEDGRIDLLYGRNAPNPGDGRRALVGIENADGTDALQFSFFEPLLGPNEAYRFEQVPTGRVVGRVTDANDGAPIEGATVTAEPGGRTATTDADGAYRLVLRPGFYTLAAASDPYTPRSSEVALAEGDEVTRDFSLPAAVAGVEPSGIAETVTLGQTATATVTVANSGSAPLEWRARERDRGVERPELPPVEGQAIREPAWSRPNVPHGVRTARIPEGLPPESLSTIIEDPPGDAQGPVDITTVRGGSDGQSLASLAIDFTERTPMSQVVGFVFFDTDQDASTGFPPEELFGKPTQDIGVDFFADLFLLREGVVLIVDGRTFEIVAEVPATVEGRTVSFDVPLEALDGDDGSIDVAMVLGDFFRPTDWAPDVGHGTIEAFSDVPWLTPAPESGTVDEGGSQEIVLTLGTPDLLPGDHHALLVLVTNAPRQRQIALPVDLTVLLPEDFGAVEGTVSDAHTGEPLDGAGVTLEAEWRGEPYVASAGTDASGSYRVFGPEGTWPLAFERDGHVGAEREVAVVGGRTVGADAALHRRQPHAELEGGPFSFLLTPDRQAQGTITLGNPEGHEDLAFTVGEVALTPVPEISARRASGQGTWLSRSDRGVRMRRNDGGSGLARPSSFRWQPASPSQELNVLVYADDVIHTPPDSLVDQALQRLGLPYTAHYDGDWDGFERDLEAREWDLVLVANDNWFPDRSVFDALHAYVEAGGLLVFHGWTVGFEPDHPLWARLGFSWAGDDREPPNEVFWWQPGHPAFVAPEAVPEFTSLEGEIYGIYGQMVEPTPEGEPLAGYTTPGPDPEQAALILGADRRTVFKGFLDGQNSADLDDDGVLDGTELWTNLILGIQGGFLSDVPWLTVEPAEGAVPPDGRAALTLTVDSTGLEPGRYRALALVLTNDPRHRTLTVPVELVVSAFQQGVNAGGAAHAIDDGTSYDADREYVPGSFGYVGPSSRLRTRDPIAGTTEDPLYQSQRLGMQAYRFDVPDGRYLVELRFAELQVPNAGDRVFSVSIEGTRVLGGFDIVEETGGPDSAVDRSFFIEVSDGRLDVEFTAPRGHRPVVNAILVTEVPAEAERSPGRAA